jgi:hypothetical protein
MTTPPGLGAKALCAAADEALIEGSFRTGEFAEAERLFTDAREIATREGHAHCMALAITGLGLTMHSRNINRLANGEKVPDDDIADEESQMRDALAAWEKTGNPAGTARALWGLSLVFQVLRHDWNGGMTYLWPAFGLAEAVEQSGDLYGASEIHRHVGFYYLYRDPRPAEAVRRLAHSLVLRERIGDLRRVPSALVALGHAELAAGDARRAAASAYRAVELATADGLLPWRIRSAEEILAKANAAVRAGGPSGAS